MSLFMARWDFVHSKVIIKKEVLRHHLSVVCDSELRHVIVSFLVYDSDDIPESFLWWNVSSISDLKFLIFSCSSLETLDADDKFFCDTCQSYQEAQKRMKIKHLPLVLCLHLKRFKYIEQQDRYSFQPNPEFQNNIIHLDLRLPIACNLGLLSFPKILRLSAYCDFRKLLLEQRWNEKAKKFSLHWRSFYVFKMNVLSSNCEKNWTSIGASITNMKSGIHHQKSHS